MRILFALLAAVFAVERDTEGEFVWKGQYFGRYWFERKRAVLNKQTCTADVCYDADPGTGRGSCYDSGPALQDTVRSGCGKL